MCPEEQSRVSRAVERVSDRGCDVGATEESGRLHSAREEVSAGSQAEKGSPRLLYMFSVFLNGVACLFIYPFVMITSLFGISYTFKFIGY